MTEIEATLPRRTTPCDSTLTTPDPWTSLEFMPTSPTVPSPARRTRPRTTPALLLTATLLAACGPREAPPASDAEPATTPGPTAAAGVIPGELVAVDPPAGAGAMAPNLAVDGDGVILSWLEPVGAEGGEHRLLYARLDGERWSRPVEVARGSDFFANWADLPAVVPGPAGGLLAHRLARLGDATYAYGVELLHDAVDDGDDGWRRLGWLHDDTSATEHGFVSWAPEAAGVWAFWLDGRRLDVPAPAGEETIVQAMELRAALLDPAAMATPEPPAADVLDRRTCECCDTDAAITAEGPIVVYRDRSPDEVRDVAVVRRTAEGWSRPALVHADGWKIHGCPVNGPAVAASGSRVAVAWFTAAGGAPRVQVAFSGDAGATFGEPIAIDAPEDPHRAPLGRVDAALDDDDRALVSWLAAADDGADGTGGGAEIRLAVVDPATGSVLARKIASTTAERSAGVPRMVRTGGDGVGRLVFAWVEDAEPSRIRAAVLAWR